MKAEPAEPEDDVVAEVLSLTRGRSPQTYGRNPESLVEATDKTVHTARKRLQEERQLAAAKAAEIERQAKLEAEAALAAEAEAALAAASATKEELHSPSPEDQHGRIKFGNAVMLALACLLALVAWLLLISLGLV